MFNDIRDDFGDEALDYALSKIRVGDCYCKTLVLCSYCAKGYN